VEENHVRTMGRARRDLLAKDIGVCVLLNSRVRSVQKTLTNALQLRISVMPMLTVLTSMAHTIALVKQDIPEMDTTVLISTSVLHRPTHVMLLPTLSARIQMDHTTATAKMDL